MKPSTRLTRASDVMRKAAATRPGGAPTSSSKSSDDGPTAKLQNLQPPHPQDYYGGFENRMPPIESGKKTKSFDWGAWGIGFLCGVMFSLIFLMWTRS